MSQNLKKRIFTSLVLFLLLIYFNFTIFFVKKLWPDFKTDDFKQIINKFKNIKRNFGSV